MKLFPRAPHYNYIGASTKLVYGNFVGVEMSFRLDSFSMMQIGAPNGKMHLCCKIPIVEGRKRIVIQNTTNHCPGVAVVLNPELSNWARHGSRQ